jgi:hypothetical protein
MRMKNHESYNKQNFENLVDYFEKELKLILQGVSASKILSESERRKILRSGILIRVGTGIHIQREVSKQTLELLSKKIRFHVSSEN